MFLIEKHVLIEYLINLTPFIFFQERKADKHRCLKKIFPHKHITKPIEKKRTSADVKKNNHVKYKIMEHSTAQYIEIHFS